MRTRHHNGRILIPPPPPRERTPLSLLSPRKRGERVCKDARWLFRDASDHNGGFSLIEIMCAILVMGVALVALTRGLTTAMGSTKDSEVETTVVSLAAGQIETLRAGGVLTDDTTDGDLGDNFPQYRWEQTVAPGGLDGLHNVEVSVLNAKSGVTLYKLNTLLFDQDYPSSSAADEKAKQRDQDKAKKRNRRGA